MQLVFWLGADLGVFISGLWIRKPSLSLAERNILLRVAMVVDIWPRVAFILTLPVGATLSRAWLPIGDIPLAIVWSIALIWLVLLVAMLRLQGETYATRLRHLHFALLTLVGIGAIAVGAWLMLAGRAAQVPWLAWKILLYGVICFLAIGIDAAFQPVLAGFHRLSASPADPVEREAANALIRPAMDRTLLVVFTLYVVLLVVSYLGVAKP
jgi:hypothetical protein